MIFFDLRWSALFPLGQQDWLRVSICRYKREVKEKWHILFFWDISVPLNVRLSIRHPQNGNKNFENTAFLLLYDTACKNATSMVFIWGDRGYPGVRFEYKTASERYLVAEI